MSKYYLSIVVSAFLSCAAMVSCNFEKSAKTEKPAEVIPEDIVELRADQIKLAGIQTGVIEKRSLSGTLKVNGIVGAAPQNLATICAPMSGFVRSTTLIPGSTVTKGQLLVVIENQ